jgi:hypothetical protein
MRDLAGDVVQNVSFTNTMGDCRTQPRCDATQFTEELTVKRREGATGEGELGGTVVGKEGVGMLEECNQDQPVINPG